MNRRFSEIEKILKKKVLLQKFQTLITSHMERNNTSEAREKGIYLWHIMEAKSKRPSEGWWREGKGTVQGTRLIAWEIA